MIEMLKKKLVDYLIPILFGSIAFYFTTQNQISNLKDTVSGLVEHVDSHDKQLQLMQIDFIKAVGDLKVIIVQQQSIKESQGAFAMQLEKSLVKIDKLQTDVLESQRQYNKR
jgi:hypothetical protein